MMTKSPSILHVLHGFFDPMANYQNIQSLIHEFQNVQADWELHYFSNASHAFTNISANDFDEAK